MLLLRSLSQSYKTNHKASPLRCSLLTILVSLTPFTTSPKSSPSPPPPPPLKGVARAVDGSDRCGSAASIGSSSFAASALKSSPSPLPPLPLKGGQVVRAVDGLDRCRGAGAWGRHCSQPVCQNHCHHCCHHHHSKVDRWHMQSMVRIGAGAWPAGGCCHLQPVH
jgi:hypothetical protein